MRVLKESCYKKTKYMRIATDTAEKLYFYTQWAGHFVCKSDFYIKRSNMRSYLLIYTVNGSGVLNYNGCRYNIEKNSVTLIDCNKMHEYFPNGDGWDFKYIHFYGNHSSEYYEFITGLYNSPTFYCSNPNIERYFDRICDNVKNLEPEEISSLTLYKILTGLISQKHHKTDVFDIYAVMDYISENYSENINVSNIASAFNFSRSYFTTLFTRQCGSSPYVYLQQYRLTAAKELLTSTNLSIDEVAYKCGFNSTSAFIRTFREHEKISPLAYRKKCTRKEQT